MKGASQTLLKRNSYCNKELGLPLKANHALITYGNFKMSGLCIPQFSSQHAGDIRCQTERGCPIYLAPVDCM